MKNNFHLHSCIINTYGLNIHIGKYMPREIGTQDVMWVPREAQTEEEFCLKFLKHNSFNLINDAHQHYE